MDKDMHSKIDSLVMRAHQNLGTYLQLAKVPTPSPQLTQVSKNANVANGLALRKSADNLISDCAELLEISQSLKKALLISDYSVINKEIDES